MFRILKHFWPDIRKYKVVMTVMIIGIVIAVGSEMWMPFFIGRFADLIAAPYTRSPENLAALWQTVLFFAITYFIHWVFWRICDYAIIYFEANAMRDIENRAFQVLHGHSFRFFQESFTGS